jgi:ribosome-associated heat shock protein Hsp15
MSIRLDVWLDVACLFKTRSEAQRACKGGKVDVNGVAARPHRLVKVGDEIVITRRYTRRQHVVVRRLTDRHVAKAQARELYEDRTPAPSAAELELFEMQRLARPRLHASAAGAPDRRERRRLRRIKEGL